MRGQDRIAVQEAGESSLRRGHRNGDIKRPVLWKECVLQKEQQEGNLLSGG